MKKCFIRAVPFYKVWTNAVIVLVLSVVAVFSAVGGSAYHASKVVNGVYCSGNENSGKVSLMINVYWGTEFLDKMLATLREYNVKATFFVGGMWAVEESDMLQKIYDDGHEIGNHGYSHKQCAKVSAETVYEEIDTTNTVVEKILNEKPTLFAPPAGSYNKKTVSIAEGLGMKVVMWTDGKDTIDWRDHDKEKIVSRATKNISSGDFVLMHPTSETADALEEIILQIREKGLDFCKVSENLA